jgi:hypothetical protein
LTTAAQGTALGSKPCTHKRLDNGKRLLQREVCVFATAIEPMVRSKPTFGASAFDGEARVAQRAALHGQSPDWVTILEKK